MTGKADKMTELLGLVSEPEIEWEFAFLSRSTRLKVESSRSRLKTQDSMKQIIDLVTRVRMRTTMVNAEIAFIKKQMIYK